MNQPSFFRSSGYHADAIIPTDSGNQLDLTTLPAFLRTLLVTDGTVTKSLEAWFWETVDVTPINNRLEQLNTSVTGLEVNAGDKVLRREVLLCGAQTQRVFAVARSTVSLKHLPQAVANALEKAQIGIGEVLREQGVETYRDIFNINYFNEPQRDDALLDKLEGDILARSYRIRVHGKPAIIVSEYFPVERFK